MNLTQREKVLAVVVGVGVVVVVAYMAFVGARGAFRQRTTQIESLESQLRDQTRMTRRGANAATRLLDYEARSLPPNLSDARTAYQKWLLNLKDKHFSNAMSVTPASENSNRGIYHQLTYSVSGTCTLDQLTNFLHEFYSVDTLHRIRTLNVQRMDDSQALRLVVFIEALSIPTAEPRAELLTKPGKRFRFADHQLEDYRNAIVNRNVFAPANRPPQLSAVSRKSATTNRELRVSLRASDPDETDQLGFELIEDSPEAARIRSNGRGGAELTWTPPQEGTYYFTVMVSDSAVPPQRATQSFEVRVTDPAPEEKAPEFDVARFTILEAVLQRGNGTREVWLDEKPSGKHHTLREGDSFEIGSVRAVVRQIRVKDVVLEVDGQTMVLYKGQALRDVKATAQGG